MITKSLLATNNTIHNIDELHSWINERNKTIKVNIKQIPFSSLEKWHQDEKGNLFHDSGKFFSIEGIRVRTDYGAINSWSQPIINQPEIGYLGILSKEFDGVLYFLMQAKVEPGNINHVQISPTLQATKSNYKQIHNGKKPLYLDYFINASPNQIILDQLQSEQGARFLRKRNRNIIIKVEEEIEELEDFRWMTLGQIKQLMNYDNLVNMDTRTVLSGLKISDYISPLDDISKMSEHGKAWLLSSTTNHSYISIQDHLSWLTGLKAKYELHVTPCAINNMPDWEKTETEIIRPDGKFFKIIGVNVTISNREVSSWCQPLVQPMQDGLCAFIVKKINGIYHFLVQAKLECGNIDVMELAPTVQCLTGNAKESTIKPEFYEYVMNASKEQVIIDALQSEEGGRFYHEQNRNLLIEADENFSLEVPENYTWMTLNQMYEFLRFNNYLNIQARSILSALNYK